MLSVVHSGCALTHEDADALYGLYASVSSTSKGTRFYGRIVAYDDRMFIVDRRHLAKSGEGFTERNIGIAFVDVLMWKLGLGNRICKMVVA